MIKAGIDKTPTALKELYSLELDDTQLSYVNDFYRLSRTRQINEAGLSAITYTEILSFLQLGLSSICFDIDIYVDIILYVDNKFRDYHAEQTKRKLDSIRRKK